MNRAMLEAHNEIYRIALTPPHAKERDDRRGILWQPSFVAGEGPANAKLAIIGEAPGETEDKERRPFCGRSGALLDEGLDYAGIDRADVYITNLIKYRPLGNADPDQTSAIAAAQLMKRELGIVNPLIAVPLGKFASMTFWLDDPSMGMLAGQRFTMRPWDDRERSVIVMPTYHPSFILRNRSRKEEWFKHIRQVREVLDGLMRVIP